MKAHDIVGKFYFYAVIFFSFDFQASLDSIDLDLDDTEDEEFQNSSLHFRRY